MRAKIQVMSFAAGAGLALSAHSAPFLVPNGAFTVAGGEDWNQNGSGGTVITYETTGGNGEGFGKIDNTAGAWGGVLVSEGGTGANPAEGDGIPLGDLGLTAGETYEFSLDMKGLGAGPSTAGMKMESWAGGALVSDSGNVLFEITSDWSNYTLEYEIASTATHIKFVPLLVDNAGPVGFDNVGGDDTPVTTTPPPVGDFMINNGDFEMGASGWATAEGGEAPILSYAYPETGGNPDGYGAIDFTSGDFAVMFANPVSLGSLGLEAGRTYRFNVDMINLDGAGPVGKFKLEFPGSTIMANTPDLEGTPTGDGSTWETYAWEVTVPTDATTIKFVNVWGGDNSNIGFDNVGGNNEQITLPPLPAGGIPNGDFETADGAGWGTTQGTPTFPTTGGNPDGNAVLDGTGDFTVLYAFDNMEVTFESLGLSPGDSYFLQMDMMLMSGSNIGGIRLEGPDGYVVEEYPTLIADGSTWETYQIELTVPGSPAQAKIGLRPGGGSVVAFDNVGIFIPETEPFVAEIKKGTVVGWTPPNAMNNYQPQESEDGVNYTDLGPLVIGDSANMVFDAEESPFYQVLEYEVLAAELLAEPSFEEGEGAWLLLDDDVTVFELSDEDIGEDLARTGNWCIQLLVDTGSSSVPSTALVQQALAAGTVAPGDELDFSFWANVEEAPVGGTVFNYSVKWRDDVGAVIGQQDGSFNTPLGVWTEVAVPGLVAPAQTDSAIVEVGAVTGAQAGDTGSVRIDDVSLAGRSSMLLPTPLPATTTDGVQICWPTKDGSSYQPKCSANLTDPFTDFGDVIPGDGGVKSVFDVIMPPGKFYRVEEMP